MRSNFVVNPNSNQEKLSLRAAVAWALYLADAQGDALIAAYLSDTLHLMDGPGKLPGATFVQPTS